MQIGQEGKESGMTTATELESACLCVKARVAWLTRCIDRGAWATPGTLQISDLDRAAAELSALATEIRQARRRLTSNVPDEYRQAAE